LTRSKKIRAHNLAAVLGEIITFLVVGGITPSPKKDAWNKHFSWPIDRLSALVAVVVTFFIHNFVNRKATLILEFKNLGPIYKISYNNLTIILSYDRLTADV